MLNTLVQDSLNLNFVRFNFLLLLMNITTAAAPCGLV